MSLIVIIICRCLCFIKSKGCLCVGVSLTTQTIRETVGPHRIVTRCGVTTTSIFHKHQELNSRYVQAVYWMELLVLMKVRLRWDSTPGVSKVLLSWSYPLITNFLWLGWILNNFTYNLPTDSQFIISSLMSFYSPYCQIIQILKLFVTLLHWLNM